MILVVGLVLVAEVVLVGVVFAYSSCYQGGLGCIRCLLYRDGLPLGQFFCCFSLPVSRLCKVVSVCLRFLVGIDHYGYMDFQLAS